MGVESPTFVGNTRVLLSLLVTTNNRTKTRLFAGSRQSRLYPVDLKSRSGSHFPRACLACWSADVRSQAAEEEKSSHRPDTPREAAACGTCRPTRPGDLARKCRDEGVRGRSPAEAIKRDRFDRDCRRKATASARQSGPWGRAGRGSGAAKNGLGRGEGRRYKR